MLSFHAAYRCGRSGRCCTSDWPIPIEADRLATARAALATGALSAAAVPSSAPLFVYPADAPADSPAVLATSDHRCVFLHHEGGHACTIQRDLGHDALPLACRQFPRVSIVDPRGVSVTLSHYCPTAASRLADARPASVVTSPPAFPAAGEYVGLDAGTSLPPLLRPDLLMDWSSWWEWEARSVDLLSNSAESVALRLNRLANIVAAVRDWTPDTGPLAPCIARGFAGSWGPSDRGLDVEGRRQEVLAAIPEALRRAVPTDHTTPPPDEGRLGRLLAAHAFANWTAHIGEGLRTWLRSVESAYALAQSGYDVGTVDLLLRHLADPGALAKIWSAAERE